MNKYCILVVREPCCQPTKGDIVSSAATNAQSAQEALRTFLLESRNLAPAKVKALLKRAYKQESTLVLREKTVTHYILAVGKK